MACIHPSQEVKIKGTFYITDHYFAFVGKKTVDLSHMELNRQFRDVMRHDEVITIKRHTKSPKALVFTDIGQVRQWKDTALFKVGETMVYCLYYSAEEL